MLKKAQSSGTNAMSPPAKPLGPKLNRKNDLMDQNHCLYWNQKNCIVTNFIEGTEVWNLCGSVKKMQIIDESPEWRNFSNDGSGKADGSRSAGDRTGSGLNMNLDSFGMEASITGGGESDKMDRIARRQQTSHDKNVTLAIMQMKMFSKVLNLNKKVHEMVLQLYTATENSGKLKGKPLEAKLAAMIYMSCKLAGWPKNLREVIAKLGCKRRDVTRCYKLLAEDTHVPDLKSNIVENLCSIWSKIGVSEDLEDASKACVEMVLDREILAGKNPYTIAGSCLYLVSSISSKPLDAVWIANAARLSDVTIRENYKKILKFKDEIIPQWYLANVITNRTCL